MCATNTQRQKEQNQTVNLMAAPEVTISREEEEYHPRHNYEENTRQIMIASGMLEESAESFDEMTEQLQQESDMTAAPVAILEAHEVEHAEEPQIHRKGRMQEKNDRKEEKRSMEESSRERLILKYQQREGKKKKMPKAVDERNREEISNALGEIKDLDIWNLQQLSDEQLASSEVQEMLYRLRKTVERFGGTQDIPGGEDILNQVYQKPDTSHLNPRDPERLMLDNQWQFKLAFHKAKAAIISAMSDKSRWIAIREAKASGREYLSKLALSKSEQKLLKTEDLDALIEEKLAEAESRIKTAKSAALSNTEFRQGYAMGMGISPRLTFEKANQTDVRDLWVEVGKYNSKNKIKDPRDAREHYNELMASPKEEDHKKAEKLQMYWSLKASNYRLAGSDERLIPEPLFRAVPALGHFDLYQKNMSVEEQREMMKKLSAGAFLEKGVDSDEEIEAARQQNKEGLRQFYDQVSICYEYLFDKYGLEPMDPLRYLEHFEEYHRDFACIQVCGNLAQYDRTVLDPEHNEKDARLVHLIDFYNDYRYIAEMSFMGLGKRIHANEFEPISYESVTEFQRDYLTGQTTHPLYGHIHNSREYLLSHPRQEQA